MYSTLSERRLLRDESCSKMRNLIELRKSQYEVGKDYFLVLDIPISVTGFNTKKEIRRCTCTGKYDNFALFEYESPKTHCILKQCIPYAEIRNATDGGDYFGDSESYSQET